MSTAASATAMIFLRQTTLSFRRHCSARSFSSKPWYITTPIFYPNASPHIGHLYSLVTADVFARYQRQRGKDVRFLTGTDEHGMKIQKAAAKHFEGAEGREKEFCDALSQRFRDLGRVADIDNTCFMRTTSDEHHRAVESVWRDLYAKGFIYKGQYSGWYSVTDECFYTDAQVDKELGIALETGAAVEWCAEENYMFRLSALREGLLAHYNANTESVYPPQYRDQVLGMLTDGTLEDISISRPRARLSWGVQVPDDPAQTVYVWFDALLIYLTGSGYPWKTPEAMRAGGWPADMQVIGKDILRFHAVYLPAILLALGDIPLAKTLLTHAHWTASNKKMSKSLGNVADPLEAIDKYGIDSVRFYLMRVGGRWRDDVDWSDVQLEKHHEEIKAQLGNYFLRLTSPRLTARANPSSSDISEGLPADLQSLFLSPTPIEAPAESDNAELLRQTLILPSLVAENMDRFEAGRALGTIMEVLKTANKTITDIAPWSKTLPENEVHKTRMVGLETVRVVGACLAPFMPQTAAKVGEALGGSDIYYDKLRGSQAMQEFWGRSISKDIKGVKLF